MTKTPEQPDAEFFALPPNTTVALTITTGGQLGLMVNGSITIDDGAMALLVIFHRLQDRTEREWLHDLAGYAAENEGKIMAFLEANDGRREKPRMDG